MKKKNAISLIVLVITIIVMAILAATVIITLSNTNIISQANEAVNKTEAQQIEEAKILMQADGMFGKNPESQTIGDTTLIWDSDSQKVIEKTTKDAITKVDTVTIPSGFYYVGGSKNTGLVISDVLADENKGVDYTCAGNQFVWVPVEYTATGETDANGLDTGFTTVFKRGAAQETSTGSGIYKMTGTLHTSYTEPYTNAEQWEKDEYNAMMLSVQKNKGFYIARFEAGDGDATSKRTAKTEAHTVVSKKNAYVYNYVSWGNSMTEVGTTGVVYLSHNMYKGSPSVVSTLCYGVQWDATMNFVSDAAHNIKDSKSWGNHSNSIGDAKTNSGDSNMNYTAGRNEAWKARNIYNLAGNVFEYTMEADSSNLRSARGGGRFYSSLEASAISRNGGDPTLSGAGTGFRVAIYIK